MNKISGFFCNYPVFQQSKVKILRKKYPYPVRFIGWKDKGNAINTAGIDGALHLVKKLRGWPYGQGVVTMEYDKWVPAQRLVINGGGK
ncbi:hypothetical protein [uncultured Mucilaginibacter sp.]|uniref:hypothetical protein n=1 Tax=uncultured Mucilaginibacter sp. TaxID=797541 RepID=UPI0025F74BA8|nr:hypothetical protein [uncultured Mucilaginibacter sp.]